MHNLNLALGLYDDPENQKQDNYIVDLYNGNIAIIGGSMSGKTTLLKTILIRMHQVLGLTDKEEIYILDFNNSLSEYGKLPYVLAYFDAMQEENIRRIFIKLEERFNENIKKLAGKSYADVDESNRPSHVTFIIDGINTFYADDRYLQYQETLQKLARDGLSKGISIVFAANETTGGISRLLNSFKTLIGFEMPKEKFVELFNTKVEKPISVKGRGLATLKNNVYEIQAYYPYNFADENMDDATAVSNIRSFYENNFCKKSDYVTVAQAKENMVKLDEVLSKKIKVFTGNLTKKTWFEYTEKKWNDYLTKECSVGEAPIGLEYYTLKPIKIDLKNSRTIAIYGRKKSGKSNALSLIIEAASNIPNAEFIIWDDERRGIISEERAPYVQRALKRAKDKGCSISICSSKADFIKIINKYYHIPKSTIDPENDVDYEFEKDDINESYNDSYEDSLLNEQDIIEYRWKNEEDSVIHNKYNDDQSERKDYLNENDSIYSQVDFEKERNYALPEEPNIIKNYILDDPVEEFDNISNENKSFDEKDINTDDLENIESLWKKCPPFYDESEGTVLSSEDRILNEIKAISENGAESENAEKDDLENIENFWKKYSPFYDESEETALSSEDGILSEIKAISENEVKAKEAKKEDIISNYEANEALTEEPNEIKNYDATIIDEELNIPLENNFTDDSKYKEEPDSHDSSDNKNSILDEKSNYASLSSEEDNPLNYSKAIGQDEAKADEDKQKKSNSHYEANRIFNEEPYISRDFKRNKSSNKKSTGKRINTSHDKFTVFIVQSRSFYQKDMGQEHHQLIQRISPYVSTDGNKLFVFSDVQKITDYDNSLVFNNWIDHAILLDDIYKFMISTKGKSSVFKDEDEEDIKERFGKCDTGDGFYFNIGFDKIDKLKFIMQTDEENE